MSGKTIKQIKLDDSVAQAVESYLTSRASEYDSRQTLITEIQGIVQQATKGDAAVGRALREAYDRASPGYNKP